MFHAHLHGLNTNYDTLLVALSICVAVLASYTAINVAGRVPRAHGRARAAWIAAAAVALGGGIWSMHFIAMLAYHAPVAVHYDVGLTALSLVIAIGITAAGFVVASRERARGMHLVAAGCVMGAGIAAMHYVGMAALRMPARIVYDPWLVGVSVVIAALASYVALRIAFTLDTEWRRIAAAVVMGGAIASMHYTGMAAASLVAAPEIVPAANWAVAGNAGLAYWVAASAGVVMAIELASVVIDHRFAARAEREADALRRSERRFRAMIENSSDVILLVDRKFRIRYAAVTPLGLAPARIEGWSVLDLVEPGSREPARALLEAAAAGTASPGEVRLVDAAGAVRDFDLSARSLLDDPDVAGMVLTLHDVTERNRAAEAVRRAAEMAGQASRAKSQFIAAMSHELRTPLNAIIGFAEMIGEEILGPVGDPRYAAYARDIHRSGNWLLRSIASILDLSRIEANEMTLTESPVDVAEIAAAAVAQEKHPEGPPVAARGDALPPVLADGRRLQQALGYLLSNAVKFTPPVGRVTVTWARHAEGGIAIAVADTGVGMKPEEIGRVMQPFVQADGSLVRRFEGLGLGLVLANGLVRLHGGRIELASAPGRGTTATIVLPAARVLRSAPPAQAAA